MTNGTTIGDLVWELLAEAIRGGLELLGVENALDHVPAEQAAFQPGDRTVGSADLGDTDGVVEIAAQFEEATPPNLRWALDLPYRVGTAVLEAESSDPRVAGVAPSTASKAFCWR